MLARPPFFEAFLSRFQAWALADRDHVVTWVPVFFGIGIALYFACLSEPPQFFVWLLFAFLLVPSLVLMQMREKFFVLWILVTALFWVACGVFVAQLRTDRLQTPIITRDLNGISFEATIKSIDTLEQGQGVRILLKDARVLNRDEPPKLHYIRLTVRKPAPLHVGDRIAGKASLFPPAAPAMPDGYDFQRHAYFQGISAYGFTYASPVVIRTGAESGWAAMMERAREKVGKVISSTLDARIAPIAIALITGERAAINDDDWQALRNSGLAHLLAISGMNVDMTAGIVFFAVRFLLSLWPWFVLRFPVKKIAAACALGAACLYVSFIVPSVPSQRALLMAAIVLIAVMLDRSPVSMRLLALTALFILMIWPEQMLGPSFQMSFAAVAGLIAFYQAFQDRISKLFLEAHLWLRPFYYVAGVVVTTIIATVATAPFSLFHFQSLALYGVIANALAVPIMTFLIMPFATLSYILIPLGVSDWALQLIGEAIEWTLCIAHFVASLKGAVWQPYAFPTISLPLVVGAGLLLILMRGWGRALSVVPLAIACFVIVSNRPPDIIVAPSGKQVVIRSDDQNVYLASKVAERRWAEDVAQALGMVNAAQYQFFPRSGEVLVGSNKISCDKQSCFYKQADTLVAFTKSPAALAEDCAQTDIVFALGFDPRQTKCVAKLLDGDDLRYQGTHTLRLTDMALDNVAAHRGQRPWVATNR